MCLCVPYPCMSHVCTCSCVEKCWRARVFISSPHSWHQLTTFPAYWTTHYRHNNIVHALCVNKLNWCWLDFLPARTTVCQSVSLSVCQSVSLSVCQSVSCSVSLVVVLSVSVLLLHRFTVFGAWSSTVLLLTRVDGWQRLLTIYLGQDGN